MQVLKMLDERKNINSESTRCLKASSYSTTFSFPIFWLQVLYLFTLLCRTHYISTT